jgi:hypothetical protein
LNFELNFDNLPTQLVFFRAKEKLLKYTWNIELDADDVIKNILVTLLDVTREVESNKLHILGRSSKRSEVPIDREFSEHHFQILKPLDGDQLVGTTLKEDASLEDGAKLILLPFVPPPRLSP